MPRSIELYPNHYKPDVLCTCDNCGNVEPASALNPIKDPSERLCTGDPLPAGECTACGALSYAPTRRLSSNVTALSEAQKGEHLPGRVVQLVYDGLDGVIDDDMDPIWIFAPEGVTFRPASDKKDPDWYITPSDYREPVPGTDFVIGLRPQVVEPEPAVIREIVDRINNFDEECEAREYTDTDDVWFLLNLIRERLTEQQEPASGAEWDWLSVRDRLATLSDCLDTPPDSHAALAAELESMARWIRGVFEIE